MRLTTSYAPPCCTFANPDRDFPSRPSVIERRVTDRILTAAEIAARQLQDELDCHTDMILVNAAAREKFDEFAKLISPDDEAYLLRKAAIQLRKTRRLEPELAGPRD